jgi:hypothetical protein
VSGPLSGIAPNHRSRRAIRRALDRNRLKCGETIRWRTLQFTRLCEILRIRTISVGGAVRVQSRLESLGAAKRSRALGGLRSPATPKRCGLRCERLRCPSPNGVAAAPPLEECLRGFCDAGDRAVLDGSNPCALRTAPRHWTESDYPEGRGADRGGGVPVCPPKRGVLPQSRARIPAAQSKMIPRISRETAAGGRFQRQTRPSGANPLVSGVGRPGDRRGARCGTRVAWHGAARLPAWHSVSRLPAWRSVSRLPGRERWIHTTS